MRVLVTGAAGYLGCRLVKRLASEGHEVVAVDRFLFGRDGLPEHPAIAWHEVDVRDIDAIPLEGVDAVASLAALSSEDAARRFPQTSYAVNVDAREALAVKARKDGARWFILPSSSNVYGPSEALLDESARPTPASVYAQTCLDAEERLLPLSRPGFGVVVFRQATLYGLSPKMRFDLVVNNLTRLAAGEQPLQIAGDGTQRRPFLHIDDAVEAYMRVLADESGAVAGSVFNLGGASDNRTIAGIADLVLTHVGRVDIHRYGDLDTLSHQLDYRRAGAELAWVARHEMPAAIAAIAQALRDDPAVGSDPRTLRGPWLAHLGGSG